MIDKIDWQSFADATINILVKPAIGDTVLIITDTEDETEKDFFDKSALNLLEGMTKIQSTSFHSLFIISSWASKIDEMIQRTMVLAYDKIILKSTKYINKYLINIMSEDLGSLI